MQAEFKIQSTHYVELTNIGPREKEGISKKYLLRICMTPSIKLKTLLDYSSEYQDFVVTIHVFCCNFNSFLKTRSLLYTLHATHKYIYK